MRSDYLFKARPAGFSIPPFLADALHNIIRVLVTVVAAWRHALRSPILFCVQIVMIGDSGVGKTSLLLRFANDRFDDSYMTTVGLDFVRPPAIVYCALPLRRVAAAARRVVCRQYSRCQRRKSARWSLTATESNCKW